MVKDDPRWQGFISRSLLPIVCGLVSCAVFVGVWEVIGSNPENPIAQVLPPPLKVFAGTL
jgi:NitT/TauT family transport system permease protein